MFVMVFAFLAATARGYGGDQIYQVQQQSVIHNLEKPPDVTISVNGVRADNPLTLREEGGEELECEAIEASPAVKAFHLAMFLNKTGAAAKSIEIVKSSYEIGPSGLYHTIGRALLPHKLQHYNGWTLTCVASHQGRRYSTSRRLNILFTPHIIPIGSIVGKAGTRVSIPVRFKANPPVQPESVVLQFYERESGRHRVSLRAGYQDATTTIRLEGSIHKEETDMQTHTDDIYRINIHVSNYTKAVTLYKYKLQMSNSEGSAVLSFEMNLDGYDAPPKDRVEHLENPDFATQVNDFKDQITTLNDKLIKLETKVISSSNDFTNVLDRETTKINELHNVVQTSLRKIPILSDKVTLTENTIQLLSQQVDKTSQELSGYKQSVARFETQIKQTQTHIQNLDKQAESYSEHVQNLNDLIHTTDQHCKQTDNKTDYISQQLYQQQTHYEQLQDTVAQIKSTSEAQQKTIHTISSQIEEIRKQDVMKRADYDKSIKDLQEQIKNTKVLVATTSTDSQKCKEDLRTTKDKINKLDIQNRQELEQIKNRLKGVEDQSQENKEHINGLYRYIKREVANLTTQIQQLPQTLETLIKEQIHKSSISIKPEHTTESTTGYTTKPFTFPIHFVTHRPQSHPGRKYAHYNRYANTDSVKRTY